MMFHLNSGKNIILEVVIDLVFICKMLKKMEELFKGSKLDEALKKRDKEKTRKTIP